MVRAFYLGNTCQRNQIDFQRLNHNQNRREEKRRVVDHEAV